MATTQTATPSIPLRFGSDAQFAEVREFLGAVGYTEARTCESLGLEAFADLFGKWGPSQALSSAPDALNLVARLFLVGQVVETGLFERHVGSALASIRALGLVVDDPDRPGCCYSPVALYPVRELFIVSDRWTETSGNPSPDFSECVFPAMTKNTQMFLATLPETPCEAFLELCSGTGVAALLAAASFAKHAWAVDITARSTKFAEFNRRLNALQNVTVLQGDLLEPVAGLTFDRIVSHPPYMPVLRPRYVFYDGGEDGELLTRRAIEQLPHFLRPGGRYYSLATGLDTQTSPLEQRMHAWLGDAAGEFDVLIVVGKTVAPETYAADATVRTRGGPEEVQQWRTLFSERGVANLVIGDFVVHRHEAPRRPAVVRRQKGPNSGPAEADWLLRWEAAAATADIATMLALRPKASPQLELNVAYRLHQGGLAPVRQALLGSYPYAMECDVQGWAAMLLSHCDGRKTAQELFDLARREGWLEPDAPASAFLDYLRVLVAGGFLEVESLPLPRR